jgi:hypothetical protein
MSPAAATADDRVVSAQLGREPRAPWRVGARCTYGFPTAVVSPSRLTDGTPFPTFAWLTCPWLSERAAAAESRGDTAEWGRKASTDPVLAARLEQIDTEVRKRRAQESDGTDRCRTVGIAGQRDPLGVKCLHAHLALALVGLDDPIGEALLGEGDPVCGDQRCARLIDDASQHGCVAHTKEDS